MRTDTAKTGWLSAAGFVFLWSTGYVVARLAMPYAPPLGFLAWRFAIASLLLGAVIFALKAPWPKTGRECVDIAVSGVLVHAGYLSGVWVAIKLGIPAALSALIVNLQPIAVAVLSARSGERVSSRQWLGLVLGFAGVVLTVSNQLELGRASSASVALCLFSLVAITTGTLWQKRRCPAFDLRTGTFIQYLASFVLVMPFVMWFEGDQPMVWNQDVVIAMLWSVFLLSFWAIFLMFRLIANGEATKVFSLFYLVPPVTALLAWLSFGQSFGILAGLGFALAALGVGLVVRPAKTSHT